MKMCRSTYLPFILLLLCGMTCCTQVDLCPETEHPHVATILTEFDWGDWNGAEEDKPTHMNIVASRILNTWRAHGIADTRTGVVENGMSAPLQAEEAGTFKLKGGEYNIFAINTREGVVIDSLNCYLTHPEAKVDTMYLHLKEMPREALPELQGINLPDFNPGYKYIQDAGCIFYSVQKGVNIQTGQSKTLRFDMSPVSQQVQVKFKVQTIGDVKVDYIIAEMSGLCGRINISEAYLDTAKLYRTIFMFDAENGVEQVDNDVTTYSASFYTMGIVPSPKESYLTGAGILQLAIFTSSGNKQHVFYAGANPRQTIIDAQMMKKENGRTYLNYTDEVVVIELESPLVIDSGKIINQEEDNTWFNPQGDINVDI